MSSSLDALFLQALPAFYESWIRDQKRLAVVPLPSPPSDILFPSAAVSSSSTSSSAVLSVASAPSSSVVSSLSSTISSSSSASSSSSSASSSSASSASSSAVSSPPLSDSKEVLAFNKLFAQAPPAFRCLKDHCRPLSSTRRLFVHLNFETKYLPLRVHYEECVCPICHSFMEDAVSALCGHSFCRVCIQREITGERGSRCPLCRYDIRDLIQIVALRNLIEQQERVCPNKPCAFTGSPSRMERHLNSQEPEICNFLPGECEGCAKRMTWKVFQEHEPTCRPNLVECIHHNRVIHVNDLRKHFTGNCCASISCVQCDEKIFVLDLADHLSTCFRIESLQSQDISPGMPVDFYYSKVDRYIPAVVLHQSIFFQTEHSLYSRFTLRCYMEGKIWEMQDVREENLFAPGFVLRWNSDWFKLLKPLSLPLPRPRPLGQRVKSRSYSF